MSATKGPEINWPGATGAALGSVTSAVFLSTLGATGTIIGAGLGTLIITVGGAVYGHYLQRAKTNIEKTADRVKRNQRGAKNSADQQSDTAPITAQRDPEHSVGSARATEKPKPSLKQVLRDISWKRVAWLAAGLFVLTLAIVLVFELATGRPVSSFTGGTSPSSTGNSLTGVTDPAVEDSQRTPEQQQENRDSPGVDQPTETPTELDEMPLPNEDLPTAPVEPAVPEQELEEIPQEVPLQEEPAQPAEPAEPVE